MFMPTVSNSFNIPLKTFQVSLAASLVNLHLIDTNDIEWTCALQFDVVRRQTFLMPDQARRIEEVGIQGTPNWLNTTQPLPPLQHASRLRVLNAASNMTEIPKHIREELKKVEANIKEHDKLTRKPVTHKLGKDGYEEEQIEEAQEEQPLATEYDDLYFNQPEEKTEYQMAFTTIGREQNMHGAILPKQVLRTRKPEEEEGNLPTTTDDEIKHRLRQERYKEEAAAVVYGEDKE